MGTDRHLRLERRTFRLDEATSRTRLRLVALPVILAKRASRGGGNAAHGKQWDLLSSDPESVGASGSATVPNYAPASVDGLSFRRLARDRCQELP
eukprot:2019508-Rhodomonas_salina.1